MSTATLAATARPANLTSRRWLIFTGLSLLVLVALDIAAMVLTDSFGLFRSPAGRNISIFYADRTAKSLLNYRYVPDNFNGLLIGPSSGVNWEPATIASNLNLRIYNESLEGGNATEEKILVDHALEHGHFKLALVVLYPSMVSTHAYKEGLDKVTRAEALGSLDAYIQTVVATLHNSGRAFRNLDASPDGSHEMHNPHGFNLTRKEPFIDDPAGMRNLQQLIRELQAHGVSVIYIVPPVYQPILAANAAAYRAFDQAMQQTLPVAPMIDLDGPEMLSFRSDPKNYIDELHLNPTGAHTVSLILNQRLRQLRPGGAATAAPVTSPRLP